MSSTAVVRGENRTDNLGLDLTAPPAELEAVVVVGERIKTATPGPLEGLALSKEQIAGNVQQISRAEIRNSRATSLADLMNARLQSVNVNDFQGNPFQMDVSYRGFTASPQLGTAQGLSVFLDGVRVNEAFGDVVNWDLIPMNALSGMDVMPGSNPLFGLNTLGGALSLRTRNGFDDAGVDGSFSGGYWGRKQGELALGGNNGTLGGFLAVSGFDEDGWRDQSPSRVMQGFGRLDWRGERFSLRATGLLVGNKLLGNGLVPIEVYRQRPESVFSSPDRTENNLQHYTVAGEFNFTDRVSLTGQVYRRDGERQSLSGDYYEDFREMDNPADQPLLADGTTTTGEPVCQYQDINHDGVPDYGFYNGDEIDPATINLPAALWPKGRNAPDPSLLPALNGDSCGKVKYVPVSKNSGPRNGAAGDPTNIVPGHHSFGVVDGTPIGVLTQTGIKQVTDGVALQLNWNLEHHKFMLGGSLDAGRTAFDSRQRLGLIDASHRVYEAPDAIDPIYTAAREDIPNNVFSGQTLSYSGYFSETWSPWDNLHLSVAGRYNHTRVRNRIRSRTRAGFDSLTDIKDYHRYRPTVIVCPTADPTSCPATANYNIGRWYSDVVLSEDPHWGLGQYAETPSSESFRYDSFNPSVGISYLPTEHLNLYFNWSQGTRTPSSVELGCAYDRTPVPQDANDPTSPRIPKSLASIGGACAPLNQDPYLPQIFARSYEFGLRGKMLDNWEWNAGIYRTDLTDDIYLIGVTATRSYFDTIGDTRRQGIEFGLSGKVGIVDFRINYGLTEASFRSHFFMTSQNNSSARIEPPPSGTQQYDATWHPIVAQQDMIEVKPGDTMPGIPLHNINVSTDVHLTERWSLGLTMIAHSQSYVRGNENNSHSQGAWEYTHQFNGKEYEYRPTRRFRNTGNVPGYATFNLRTSYDLGKGFRVFALVNNLFDRQYFSAGRLGINPFSPSDYGAIGPSGWNYNSNDWRNTTLVGPGAPRAFWIGVDFQY